MRKNWVWVLLGSVGLFFVGFTAWVTIQAVGSRPSPPTWVAPGRPSRIGDVEVRVISAEMTKPELEGPFGVRSTHPGPITVITFTGANVGTDHRIDYRLTSYSLTDDHDNVYKEISNPLFSPPGRKIDNRLDPGESIRETLLFEPPVKNARTLYFNIDGGTFGLGQPFRFAIPVAGLIKH